MFGFRKRVPSDDQRAVVASAMLDSANRAELQLRAEPPDISTAPIGARLFNLTQVGTLWLDFDSLIAMDFSPADGCGAELRFKNSKQVLHVNRFQAACLLKYIDQQRAEIGELDRIASKTE